MTRADLSIFRNQNSWVFIKFFMQALGLLRPGSFQLWLDGVDAGPAQRLQERGPAGERQRRCPGLRCPRGGPRSRSQFLRLERHPVHRAEAEGPPSHLGDWDVWKLATSSWGGRDKCLIPRTQEEK